MRSRFDDPVKLYQLARPTVGTSTAAYLLASEAARLVPHPNGSIQSTNFLLVRVSTRAGQ